ncbi:cupin domain-containing protein [Haloarculaceae archaeon H-GB2-1]|nr:cupin domain-containing protein [Haloarculaceae archaeon H-GB1-1]MEA5387046.1 cupin domain-containing protein [Haloarculaceae archaeon H-GB11]MEA5408548.1 cupin domain-containing protein [Haloarculaceae archaeon H-GB2-1]
MKHAPTDATEWFELVLENERGQAASMTLEIDESTGGPENRHPDSVQWLYVVDGTGEAIVEGEPVPLSPGELVLIERGEGHEIRNTGDEPLETLNLYVPPRPSASLGQR